jgi:hypothetical protein
VPHASVPVQPSEIVPHDAKASAHVLGVQLVHAPQSIDPPQPSACTPHVTPAFAHVIGVQAGSGSGSGTGPVPGSVHATAKVIRVARQVSARVRMPLQRRTPQNWEQSLRG